MYDVMVDPLLSDGVAHRTIAVHATPQPPGDADTDLGAVGAPTFTATDWLDGGPVPFAFVAAIVNAYESPFVKPPSVALVAVGPNTSFVWAAPDRYGVRMYWVTAEPLVTGGCQLTVNEPLPGLAVGRCQNTGVPTRTDTGPAAAPV